MIVGRGRADDGRLDFVSRSACIRKGSRRRGQGRDRGARVERRVKRLWRNRSNGPSRRGEIELGRVESELDARDRSIAAAIFERAKAGNASVVSVAVDLIDVLFGAVAVGIAAITVVVFGGVFSRQRRLSDFGFDEGVRDWG